MRRISEIRNRVTYAASRETAVSQGKMRIPGMKIGSQMSPAGPKLEDVIWLCDTLEQAAAFMKTAEYTTEKDMHMAMKLVHDIEEAR
jgi:hypothetical protein